MSPRLEIELPRERGCARIARHQVESLCRDAVCRDSLDDLKLVVSELVDNAFLHGSGHIGLKLALCDGRVRIEVRDEGSAHGIAIRPEAPGIGGWGLRIVDRLSLAWGAADAHVWAELPVT